MPLPNSQNPKSLPVPTGTFLLPFGFWPKIVGFSWFGNFVKGGLIEVLGNFFNNRKKADRPAGTPLPWAACLAILFASLIPAQAQWTQWGGPQRNFSVESGKLAVDWPETGPPEIWSRPFGDGYSSILFEDGRLYSLHRDGDQDVAVCLDPATGETIWSTSYEAPSKEDMILQMGPGPISTPLLAGDKLFAVSSTVVLTALDKHSGKILWSRDLMAEAGASHLGRGYGASPIAYGNLVILPVGGKDHGIVAFDQSNGDIVWKSETLRAGYTSPIIARVEGEDQLIAAMANQRLGLNPATGEIQWRLELSRDAGVMMATPNWGPDNILFESQAYSDGSRAFELHKRDAGFEAKELWANRRMRVMFAPFVRIGDYVYGSSGDFGPAFLMAVDVKTGEVAWRKRGFNRTHFLHADGKVVLLDEEGDLAIADVSPEGIEVHAKAHVLERNAWTPPTLVGTRLYLRNRKVIKALELGEGPIGSAGRR